jgi:predicted nucleic acid-binding protein
MRASERGQSAVLELLERGIVEIPFRLSDHLKAIEAFLKKYHDIGISLADACLVHMSELYAESTVLTVDGHFKIYRKSNRQVIRTLSPNYS